METGIGISTPLNVWENGQQKNVQHQTCLATNQVVNRFERRR